MNPAAHLIEVAAPSKFDPRVCRIGSISCSPFLCGDRFGWQLYSLEKILMILFSHFVVDFY